ncbi:MAG: prenyltransferase/squalene oxidase repeat-containing protein [Planctomycetota bacterium]
MRAPTLRHTSTTFFLASAFVLAFAIGAAAPAQAPVDAAKETPAASPPPAVTKSQLKSAIDRGCNWLIDQQRADGGYGSYVSDVGITALVVHGLARSPRHYEEEDGPFLSAAVDLILSHRHADGSIYEKGRGLWNYKTSMSILALAQLDQRRKEPRYAATISGARDYVASLQCSDISKPLPYDRDKNRNAFGGIGYGSDRRPDLSNTQFALEALRAGGLAEDSDVFQRVQLFLSRCQNHEKNDLLDGKERSSTGDGGFFYQPGESKAGVIKAADGSEALRSYGSMTYAGVKSYIYAGLGKDDPRVQGAWNWIKNNFTVDENPGMATPVDPKRGQMGLFYYYVMMARTFEVLDVQTFEDASGKKIDWVQELGRKMLSLQHADGYWKNPVSRWMEADPAVVTSYAVWALSIAYEQMP